jgi:cytokinin dehydrogenase
MKRPVVLWLETMAVMVQIADNRRLYELAVRHGGYFYPVDSVPMTQSDWQQHFGDEWNTVVAAKGRFDPQQLLNPSQGIFVA